MSPKEVATIPFAMCVVLMTVVLTLLSPQIANAGSDTMDDVMAMELVWEQVPSQYAGPGSDSDLLHPVSGERGWVFYADDVLLEQDVLISRVTWQGFYDHDNPPEGEVMRLRVYDARPSDALPGDVLYEVLTTSHTRAETGRHMAASVLAREFTYSMDLSTFPLLQADERYWIEISQIGFVESAFRLVQAYPQEMAPVFVSSYASNWEVSGYGGTSFQLWAVPEPSSAMLIYLVLGAGLVKRRR